LSEATENQWFCEQMLPLPGRYGRDLAKRLRIVALLWFEEVHLNHSNPLPTVELQYSKLNVNNKRFPLDKNQAPTPFTHIGIHIYTYTSQHLL